MVDIKIESIHVKTLKSTLRTKDIESLIMQAVGANEFTINNPAVKYEIRWEDETEGSPPYKIGVKAHVTITKDMNYVEECDSTRAPQTPRS